MITSPAKPPVLVDNPAIRTTSLERGTFLTTDLAAARRLFEEVLDLETVRYAPDAIYVRERGHRPGEPYAGQPYLVLDVREVPVIENPQAMLNHWGVFVASQTAVDLAYAALVENQERYGLKKVQKPRAAHGAYSFYFEDADSNWWEVEHRIPKRQYETLRAIGDVV
jgi:catechol 2,3-dioxygenase-like lactoylglutathione lyase family enzyme